MMLFNPWVWLGAILVLVGTFFAGRHEGYKAKDQEDQVAIAAANEQARATEQTANKKVSDISNQLVKAKLDAKTQIAKRDADIAANKLQLFIRTKAPVSSSPDAPAAGGSNTGTAQLDPTFAQSIVAITDDGDTAIRKLNACIATYNQVKDLINGSPTTR